MGYVFSGEHLLTLSFTPARGPVYASDWCWSARVLCSPTPTDPGPEVERALHAVRGSVDCALSLHAHAIPAWNWETLHPFALRAALRVRDTVIVNLAGLGTGRANLLDVSLWEHGQGPRSPVLTVTPQDSLDGRTFHPIN